MLCKKCGKEIPDSSIYCNLCGWKQSKDVKTKKGRQRGNGMGTAYKLPNGKWQAETTMGYRVENGKHIRERRTKSGFMTKKEALEYIPQLRQGVEHTREIMTLSALWESWSTSAMLKLSSSKQTHYKSAYKKLESIINIKIADLTIGDLQISVDNKAVTYYPAKDMKVLLSHLYKRAMAQQDVQTNLADFIVLPEMDESKQTPFNEEELKALWKDYGNGSKFTGYILLMIYSGMMPGELYETKKSMIDWGKQSIIGCGIKTKKRKETPIVIADIILPVLKDLCEFSGFNDERLINIRRDLFYSEFDLTLNRCGCRDLPPYSCRHTTATALALGNIAPSVIQEVMRHTKFSTTQRYIHIDTAPMLDAVNEILKD